MLLLFNECFFSYHNFIQYECVVLHVRKYLHKVHYIVIIYFPECKQIRWFDQQIFNFPFVLVDFTFGNFLTEFILLLRFHFISFLFPAWQIQWMWIIILDCQIMLCAAVIVWVYIYLLFSSVTLMTAKNWRQKKRKLYHNIRTITHVNVDIVRNIWLTLTSLNLIFQVSN